jgi:putative transposase|nr:RNA-guided endonuclease TnpB family protein [Butyrivibrio sp.]
MKTTILRAVKGRIYTSKTKYQLMDKTLYACNYIYNHMIERNQKVYKRREEHLSYYEMQNLLPVMKKYNPWLKDADSQALKYACRQVDTAYRKFFKREAAFPRYHSRKQRLSYTTTNTANIKVLDGAVKLPIIGTVKVHGLRKLPDNAKLCYATVSKETDGKYYVSVTYKYEIEVNEPLFNADRFIGLDYKSDGLFVDSDGNCPKMPHYLRESQTKMIKAQRKLSKKYGNLKGQKKSSGWIKQHRKLTKVQKKISNQREDYLHKLSKQMAEQYSGIAVEDINMRSLSNKSFGNGKATLDNGFGEFRRQLEYKLNAQGKPFIKVDKFFASSQICSCCGYKNTEIKALNIRKWECPKCHIQHDRDHNAAINIRNEGLKILVKSKVA